MSRHHSRVGFLLRERILEVLEQLRGEQDEADEPRSGLSPAWARADATAMRATSRASQPYTPAEMAGNATLAHSSSRARSRLEPKADRSRAGSLWPAFRLGPTVWMTQEAVRLKPGAATALPVWFRSATSRRIRPATAFQWRTTGRQHREIPREAMPQARPPSNQGLKTATPVTAKCLTLRVASTMEFAMATAAICASSIGTRPGIGYFAKIRAAARSNGNTLPSKAGRTWAANQRRSTSPWAGSTASLRQTPRSISAIVNAVTN